MSDSKNPTAYDFAFESIDGGPLPLSDYRGKMLLIVNTASLCAFTHQYKSLGELYKKYGDHGLTVIGVPSNDFQQEPEEGAKIKQFCQINYFTHFPLTAKVHVRGKNAHTFFKWIGAQGGFFATPKWNFYKYLIGTDGQLISWHLPTTSPLSRRITGRIEKQLHFTAAQSS